MKPNNVLNREVTVNNGIFILGIILAAVIALGSFFIGFAWPGQRQGDPPVESLLAPSSTSSLPGDENSGNVQVSATPTVEDLPTETVVIMPTETLMPTETGTPEATQTPTLQATLAPTTRPADQAKLIKNIVTTNGGYFAPKKLFTKIWIVQNIGTTTWNKDYVLVFVSGTAMTDQVKIPIQSPVKPGKMLTIELSQTAPSQPGVYQGFWMLRNDSGQVFGIGPEGDQALISRATVLNVVKGIPYDFLLSYCDATWWNSEGETIPCQGTPNRTNGFVLLDPNPSTEKGLSDLPGLWVHPYLKVEGAISGRYPAYTVQDGDHFRAQAGCINGNTNCNITFKLLYNTGSGPNITLGTWKELYGGGITKINVDLSALAGEQVQFILRAVVSNNSPEDANGVWLIPRIVNE